MKCPNCKQEMKEGAKVFAAVVVCPTCFLLAKSFNEKVEHEFKQLQLLVLDKTRELLVTGKFHLGGVTDYVVDKQVLLETVSKVAGNHD